MAWTLALTFQCPLPALHHIHRPLLCPTQQAPLLRVSPVANTAGSGLQPAQPKARRFQTCGPTVMVCPAYFVYTIAHARPVPRRLELNQVIGSDMLQPTTEIATIPCAGARISHGPMAGLMAYRFVVRLDGSPSSTRQAVVTNFILDTGNGTSPIPQETLTALGYRGSMKRSSTSSPPSLLSDRTVTAGTEVTLLIQGVKTKCVVAPPGEAGRVGLSFMTAGSLTYYFDPGLVAPVLYGQFLFF